MTLIIAIALLVALAVAAPAFGRDSRSGRQWSVGALLDERTARPRARTRH